MIIDPLDSRCVKFHFSRIAREAQIETLKLTCEREGVEVANEDVLKSLVDISQGDLRRSINMLQTASSFKAKNLTAKDIESISGMITDDVIKRIDKVLSTS
jgi:replication factor C subunit 2/4